MKEEGMKNENDSRLEKGKGTERKLVVQYLRGKVELYHAFQRGKTPRTKANNFIKQVILSNRKLITNPNKPIPCPHSIPVQDRDNQPGGRVNPKKVHRIVITPCLRASASPASLLSGY